MEKWKEEFAEIIPIDDYTVTLIHGEEDGLCIKLTGKKYTVCLDFGYVYATRILDEGIVQAGVYPENEVKNIKSSKYKNVLYKVHEGVFLKDVIKMSDGYLIENELNHYVIITQNSNIDIVSGYEPDIVVTSIKQKKNSSIEREYYNPVGTGRIGR